MGREIKRVQTDFDWPLGKVWQGYVNPYYGFVDDCPACHGSGLTPEAKQIDDQWYGYTHFDPKETGSNPLTIDSPVVRQFVERNIERNPEYYPHGFDAEANRLISMWNGQWCHHLEQVDVDALVREGRLPEFAMNGIENPTAKQVNDWSIGGFGHDSINRWVVVRTKCERLGIDLECTSCGGSGEKYESTGHKHLYEKWEPIEPPAGEGWQLWENVSEGSPISPVFQTEKEFKDYLIGEGYSQSAVDNFIKQGFAFSAVVSEKGVQVDIEALGEE